MSILRASNLPSSFSRSDSACRWAASVIPPGIMDPFAGPAGQLVEAVSAASGQHMRARFVEQAREPHPHAEATVIRTTRLFRSHGSLGGLAGISPLGSSAPPDSYEARRHGHGGRWLHHQALAGEKNSGCVLARSRLAR
jgi:hypothetical protein